MKTTTNRPPAKWAKRRGPVPESTAPIQRLRVRAGLTQEEAVESILKYTGLSVSVRNLRRMETGERQAEKVYVDHFQRLIEARRATR